MRELLIIGLGSGGSILSQFAARYLGFSDEELTMVLIDGDDYKTENAPFQIFDDLDNKAVVQSKALSRSFPQVNIRAVPRYIIKDNIDRYINDGCYILLAVDNHATRKLVSDYCETLENVTLISGGIGGLTKGHVQAHIRRDGKDLAPPITYLHPEIQSPSDFNPGEVEDCEAKMLSEPQLLFTGATTASYMLAAFYTVLKLEKDGKLDEFPYSELYLDVLNAKVRTEKRVT